MTITNSEHLSTVTTIITGKQPLVLRVLRLLALIDYCSRVGHSTMVGMWIDGDGPDRIRISVDENPDHLAQAFQPEIERMESGKEGYKELEGRVEVASDKGYWMSRYIYPPKKD